MFMLCLHFKFWKFLFQGKIMMWRYHVVSSKYARNQSKYTWRTKWCQYPRSILFMQIKDLEKIITMICVEAFFCVFEELMHSLFIFFFSIFLTLPHHYKNNNVEWWWIAQLCCAFLTLLESCPKYDVGVWIVDEKSFNKLLEEIILTLHICAIFALMWALGNNALDRSNLIVVL